MPVPRRDMMMLALAINRAKLAAGTAGKLETLSLDTVEKVEQDARAWADASGNTVVQLPDGKVTLSDAGRIVSGATLNSANAARYADPPPCPTEE